MNLNESPTLTTDVLPPEPLFTINQTANGYQTAKSSLGSSRLILHCGGELVSEQDLENLPTPPHTRTHYPVPHAQFLRTVRESLRMHNLEVAEAVHALGHDGDRYFSLLALRQQDQQDPYGFVLGLRNSHDKHVACRVAVGTRVFVCDNMAFSAEVVLARKNTRHALVDLPSLTSRAIGDIGGLMVRYGERVRAYQQQDLTDKDAAELIMRMVVAKVLTGPQVAPTWDHWRVPPHEQFQDRTVWSLFNGVTEQLKSLRDPAHLIHRTSRLHALCDGATGVIPHALEERPALEA